MCSAHLQKCLRCLNATVIATSPPKLEPKSTVRSAEKRWPVLFNFWQKFLGQKIGKNRHCQQFPRPALLSILLKSHNQSTALFKITAKIVLKCFLYETFSIVRSEIYPVQPTLSLVTLSLIERH